VLSVQCILFRPECNRSFHADHSLFSLITDGLYVLLRPVKKKKKKQGDQLDLPQPPPHLQHLLMEEDMPETCPWSLSGPQFPVPTAIQQRYCYPKGRPEYSSRKGGALWTMYGADGVEDVQYRLLHVYFSAKRAINKGMSGFPDGSPTQLSALRSPPRKRSVKQRSTPPRRALPKRKVAPHQNHQQNELYHSPAITTSSVTSSSLCNSPLSFEQFPHLSFQEAPTNGSRRSDGGNEFSPAWPEQLIVTPINDIDEVPQSARKHPPSSADRQLHQNYFSEDNQRTPGGPMPSPFRAQINVPASTINVQNSPLFRTGDYTVEMPSDDTSISSSDPFHLEFPLQHEIDSFWNDPLMTIMMKPSHDFGANSSSFDGAEPRHSPAHMFALRLESLQDNIRDRILSAPVSEQPKLVNVMATWARKMAIDPLALPGSGAQQNGARLKDDTEVSSTVGV